MRGLMLADALALVGLIWLAWRVKRQGNMAASTFNKFMHPNGAESAKS
jgi:hypothetical protein